jgi:hypothetical protein
MTTTSLPKPPAPRKLGADDRRALAHCQTITQEGRGTVVLRHVPSRTWGTTVRLEDERGERIASTAGCGYCKASSALAEALRFLGDEGEPRRSVYKAAGCGVSSVVKALAAIGWELRCTYDGRREEVYELSRIA